MGSAFFVRPVLATGVVYLALVGWGWLAAKLLRPRREPHWGMRAAWGLVVTTVLGGPLNLLGAISRPLVRAYIAAGVIALVVMIVRGRGQGRNRPRLTVALDRRRLLIGGAALVLSAMTLMAVAGGAARVFNPHDDFHAYLGFPVKMLETGTLGSDPFSERRMLEYGGQSLLHAVMLGFVDLSQVHVVEFGVGPLIVIGLLIGHARRRRVPAWFALLMVFFFLTVSPPLENLTSVMTGLAVFYALMEYLADPEEEARSTRGMVLALLITGLFTLKNSHIPGAMAMVFFVYVFADRRPMRTRVVEVAIVGAASGIMLLPWMVSMLQSSGTPLYPLLGQGYNGSVYGRYIPVTCGTWSRAAVLRELEVLIESPHILAGFALMIVVGLSSRRREHGSRTAAWCCFGAYVAALVVDVTNGGMGPRYAWSYTFACLLFIMMESMGAFIADPPRAQWSLSPLPIAAALMLCVLIGKGIYDGDARRSLSGWGYEAIKDGRASADDVHEGAEALRRIQRQIPAGQPVLARLSRPFNLDFSRNIIYVVDWPGGASPPPGMPLETSAEDLARYLRSRSIRYVLYSHGDQANYSYGGYRHRIRPGDGYVARARVATELTFLFQQRLIELAQSYRALADDGRVFALDLERPKS